MKKLSILLTLLILMSVNAFSQKVAYAVFKDSTLTFYYNDKKPDGAYDVEKMVKGYYTELKEWYSISDKIKTVIFDESVNKYRPKSCSRWFKGCENLTSIIGIKENLNTSEVTDMSWMFWDCENLTSLDVSGFNTENVTDMSSMFWGCENLASLDVSGFSTEKGTDMTDMFEGCESLTSLDVSGFNTENVTEMQDMFLGCKNLTSLDVSGFNTEKVTNMWRMFSDCETLKTIYVGDGWNISNVRKSKDMFNNCPNLIGGQGTEYDENHLDASYAHIDGGESNPGYLTKKTK